MAVIKLYSDLHLEFADFIIPKDVNEENTILVLAGDIAVVKNKSGYVDFITDACNRFSHVVYVLGNHEYYKGNFYNVVDKLKATLPIANLHILENESVTLGDVTFVGSTLWADFNGQNPLTMIAAKNFINDFHVIKKVKNDKYKGKLTPQDVVKQHLTSYVYLMTAIQKAKETSEKVVVVTHFAPSFQSTRQGFEGDALNGYYMTELGWNLMDMTEKGVAPDLWVHGHVHSTFDYKIGDTQIMSNPRGYEDENPNFNPNFLMVV